MELYERLNNQGLSQMYKSPGSYGRRSPTGPEAQRLLPVAVSSAS